jgi:hypothetical protein
MRARAAAALLLLASTAAAQDRGGDDVPAPLPRGAITVAEPTRITMDTATCVRAAAFPMLRARIEPWAGVTGARLSFRPEGYALWYQVALQRTAEDFVAVLPKPRPSAQRIHYFVEAHGQGGRARSPEAVLRVVEDPSECTGPVAAAVESASIVVRVPRGAPPVPPVPPGFVPAGARSAPDTARRRLRGNLLVAGGLAAAVGGLVAIPHGDTPAAGPQPAPNQIQYLDSVPPPGSRLSLSDAPTMTLRVRVRVGQPVGPGLIRMSLFRQVAPGAPCAVLLGSHAGFQPGTQDVTISGGFAQAMSCQPADRLRLTLEEAGRVIVTTGTPEVPDYPAIYFILP